MSPIYRTRLISPGLRWAAVNWWCWWQFELRLWTVSPAKIVQLCHSPTFRVGRNSQLYQVGCTTRDPWFTTWFTSFGREMAQMAISVARSPFSGSVMLAKKHCRRHQQRQGQNPGEEVTQVSTSSSPCMFPGPLTASFQWPALPAGWEGFRKRLKLHFQTAARANSWVGAQILSQGLQNTLVPLSDNNRRRPPFILFQIRPPVIVITSSDTIDDVIRWAVSNLHG